MQKRRTGSLTARDGNDVVRTTCRPRRAKQLYRCVPTGKQTRSPMGSVGSASAQQQVSGSLSSSPRVSIATTQAEEEPLLPISRYRGGLEVAVAAGAESFPAAAAAVRLLAVLTAETDC
ncbi:unnamed protein product [Closterium sp. NIES-64]|nr:unnamed protein product [Closterium sp. NIES-65]CAI5980412.1 unnamed protein product [Closterium sp. NIES-64]